MRFIIIKPMKLQVVLSNMCVKSLSGLLTTLKKTFFSTKKQVRVYFIYFMNTKQIRLLIACENDSTVIAFDETTKTKDQTTGNTEKDILSMEIIDNERFINCLKLFSESEQQLDIKLTTSKEKYMNDFFRCIVVSSHFTEHRCEIRKPLYDDPTVLNHSFLNGCMEEQYKVEFKIEAQHLLNILRVVIKDKSCHKNCQQVKVIFDFDKEKLFASLEYYSIKAQSLLQDYHFKGIKYKGRYEFFIPVQFAKHMSEIFEGKVALVRFMINEKNKLIALIKHEGIYESQILINDWITFRSFDGHDRHETEIKTEM